MIVSLWVGCADLDGFVFNPVHCSTVGPETCEDVESPWDAVCVPCGEPYDWTRDYPWFPQTLAPREVVRPVDAALVTAITVPSDDGEAELDAYFVSAHGEDPAAARVTVVYNHGNYAGIEHYLPRVRYLHEAGYNVFVWDYRGYGKSLPDTTPTAEQHLADADAVWAVARTFAPDPARVVSYGYSLGAITATQMGLRDPCAVILENPFTSLSTIAQENTTLSLGEQFLSAGLFDNHARLDRIEAPVLGMSGTEDDLFATEEVRALVERGPGPRTFWAVEGAHHGVGDVGIPEAGLEPYLGQVAGFLQDEGCQQAP